MLSAELRCDVDVGNVVAGRRVDAVEGFEEHPVLSQSRGDFVQASLGIADKAVGESALVIARIGVIKARIAFEGCFPADVPRLRQRHCQHGIANRSPFAQSPAPDTRPFEVTCR